MNKELLRSIVKHIYSGFGVLPSVFIDLNRSKSLMSPEYLLPEKLRFESEGTQTSNKVWGCQMSLSKQEVKILLGDCTQPDSDVPEFAMLVQVKDMPAYGLYLAHDPTSNGLDEEPMIAAIMGDKAWVQCTTFLQATFLAGMEQLREINMVWDRCTNYQAQYQKLLGFIKFHAAANGG